MTACWIWTGHKTHDGYGQFGAGYEYAHVFAYELIVGPAPDGLDLDHLCRVRDCVRPLHLEPVTRRENLLRGDTIPARNAAKATCSLGHPYSLRKDGTGRFCRTCEVNRHRARAGTALLA